VSDTQANLDAWLKEARKRVSAAHLAPRADDVGRVETVADGIAIVSGLRDVRADELLRFEHGQAGFALTLDRDTLGCVLLDDIETVEAGHQVRGTGEVVRVPVGPALLGRTVDPLGRALDEGPAIETQEHQPIERPAPAIIDRDFVREPVYTGLLVLDSMFALGRGQRELIIGDRAVGKTAIAVDCIINQKNSDIV
jgi:F-type H+-transporting ATPase subunit alpha